MNGSGLPTPREFAAIDEALHGALEAKTLVLDSAELRPTQTEVDHAREVVVLALGPSWYVLDGHGIASTQAKVRATVLAPIERKDARADYADLMASRMLRVEMEMLAAMNALIDRQERATITRLHGAKARRGTRYWNPPGSLPLDVVSIVRASDWRDQAREDLLPIVRRAVIEFGQITLRQLGEDGFAREIEALEGKRLVEVIQAVDQVFISIRDAVAKAADWGERFERLLALRDASEDGLEEIDRALAEAAEKFRIEARRNARTAATRVANETGMQLARSAGARSKEWITERDERVRASHRDVDKEIRPITEPFVVGIKAARMQFPGDPSAPYEEIANCRCTLRYHKYRGRARIL